MVESGFHARLCRECRLGNLRIYASKMCEIYRNMSCKIRGFVAYWTCWCCLVFFSESTV